MILLVTLFPLGLGLLLLGLGLLVMQPPRPHKLSAAAATPAAGLARTLPSPPHHLLSIGLTASPAAITLLLFIVFLFPFKIAKT